MRIEMASKNRTTVLLHRFNSLGHRTFWQRYGANFIYIDVRRGKLETTGKIARTQTHTLYVCISILSVCLSLCLPICLSIL
jgi:hypothetical protein